VLRARLISAAHRRKKTHKSRPVAREESGSSNPICSAPEQKKKNGPEKLPSDLILRTKTSQEAKCRLIETKAERRKHLGKTKRRLKVKENQLRRQRRKRRMYTVQRKARSLLTPSRSSGTGGDLVVQSGGPASAREAML